VAVYTRPKPVRVIRKIGWKKFDDEGRFLRLDFPQLTRINFYLPHGGRGKEDLKYKLAVYDYLLKYFRYLKNKKVFLAGDFNVAHREIDLARPKENENNIMFTPREREQIDRLLKLGFVDSFRRFNGQGGHYTWWPYFARARERNFGWRIDYIFFPSLLPFLEKAFIRKNFLGSDHCPVGIKVKKEIV